MIDFSVIKQLVGEHVDRVLDHAMIVNPDDDKMIKWLSENSQKFYVMPRDLAEPSAENLARLVLRWAREMLTPLHVHVTRVRLYETPNGWADAK